MRRLQRVLTAVVVPLAVVPLAVASGVRAGSPDTPVPGTDARGLGDADRLGDADGASSISFAVTLPLRNQAQLHSLVAAVSDPASPQHGQYLTPQQFDASFAPTPAQVQTVTAYLASQSITVTGVSSNGTVVDARGTTRDVARAFGTTIGKYHDRRAGTDFIANDGILSAPAGVAPDILGVVGLSTHYARHPGTHPPRVGAGPAGGYTPAQLKSGYDVSALASAGYTGSGEHVGLFELDGFQQANISTYDSQYGLGSAAPSVVNVDGGSGSLGSGQIEVELDIEVVQAMAPAASITVWEGPNTDQGVIDTYNAMATSDTTPSNSTSWGLCEPNSNTATINSEDQVFAQMATQGQSLFAASGDSGAYDCGSGTGLSVDNPADDPHVTGTGGTNLNLTSANAYSSESAWGTGTQGGGGGLSTVFSKPAWQSAPGVPSTQTMRSVPDVSSDAAPATGYSIYTRGGWTVVGGTSAAAPMWAGFTAAYNQDAVANAHARLGFANPTLYTLASNSQTYAPYHDVTSGSNLHYNAGAGYDYATGLGTYDAYDIARDLVGAGTTTNDFSIAASPASLSVAAGSVGTSTISTAVTSGSAQTVALSVSGAPSGATASLSPTSVSAGASSTLSVNTGTAAAGTYTLTVTGTGASATHSTPVSLTVTSSGGGGVVNGGFETGTLSGWTASGPTAIVSSGAQSGTYAARVGSTSPSTDSSIAQTFTIPTGGTSLSFFYDVVCPDTVTYDWATATLRDNTTGTTTTVLPKTCVNPSSGWRQVTTAVTAGHSVTLTLANHDDNYSADPTSTLYDSVAVSTSVASGDFSIAANPSSLGVTRGSNGTVTVSTAVTSGSAQTVSLSASGLPSGASASFNPASVTAGAASTMTIATTTSTPTGTYTVTVTGTGTSATHSTSVTLTVSAASGGPVVTNGGFETGSYTGWTTSGANEGITTTAHSGSYSAILGSTSPTNGDSTMTQTVTIPTSASTLTFWYANDCPDTVTYDWALVQIRSTSGAVLATPLQKTCASAYTWTAVTYSVTSLRGQTVVLAFTSHDDNYGADPTFTLYDDISIS